MPEQFSTGGRTMLGSIAKRGSRDLQMLLIWVAWIIMTRPHLWPNFSFGNWLAGAVARVPANKVAIALVNRLAWID